MEEELRYGKRKKKRIKTPNPLFEVWLREWKEEAAEKGIKSQYVYAKVPAVHLSACYLTKLHVNIKVYVNYVIFINNSLVFDIYAFVFQVRENHKNNF